MTALRASCDHERRSAPARERDGLTVENGWTPSARSDAPLGHYHEGDDCGVLGRVPRERFSSEWEWVTTKQPRVAMCDVTTERSTNGE